MEVEILHTCLHGDFRIKILLRTRPLSLLRSKMGYQMEDVIFYNLSELSAILNIPKTKVYLYIKSGKLRAHKHSASWQVLHDDLQAFTNRTAQFLPPRTKPKVDKTDKVCGDLTNKL